MNAARGPGRNILLGVTLLAAACSRGSSEDAQRTTTTTSRPTTTEPSTTTTTTKEQWCQSISSAAGELATGVGRVGITNVPVVPVPEMNVPTTSREVSDRGIYLLFFRTFKLFVTEHGSVYGRLFNMFEGVRAGNSQDPHYDVKQLVELQPLESDPGAAFMVPRGSRLILPGDVGFTVLERGSDPLAPLTPVPATTFIRDSGGRYRYATPEIPSPMSPYIERRTLEEARVELEEAFERGELSFDNPAVTVEWGDGTAARVARDCEPHVVALENPANRLVAP